MSERAILVLEDGSSFRGYAFGAAVDGEGEVVFNTGMTGYQEICTDPSYRGQMVVLTYPLIGNYGVNTLDAESRRPWISALIVRGYYPDYSNWRAEQDLDSYLREAGVPGLYGIDTRALTRRLRSQGALRAILTLYEGEPDIPALIERAGSVVSLTEKNLVHETATPQAYRYGPPLGFRSAGRGKKVVVVDCGIKQNIMRSLRRRGVEVIVLPHAATALDVLRHEPDGVVLGNGPGDPATLPGEVTMARALIKKKIPLLGICLGHQLIGQAIGGKTSRLPFGHHGGNHPVKDLRTGEVHITSQNHEFQLDADSVPAESGFFVSQINLNDGSVEGLAHPDLPVSSVQYHPEGSPGPQDSQYIFDDFIALLNQESR